jgi:hypothetical protein
MSQVDVIVSGREAAAPPAPLQTLVRAVTALRDHTVQVGEVLNLTSEFIDLAYGSAVRLHLPLFQRQVAVAASEVERVEAYSPEWLARQYPSQVLRGDEVLLTSVELIILGKPPALPGGQWKFDSSGSPPGNSMP